jgi:microcystin-dependent protein
LGATGGALAQTLGLTQIPTGITSSKPASIAVAVTSTGSNFATNPAGMGFTAGSTNSNGVGGATSVGSTGNLAIGAVPVTSNNTGGAAHANVQPTIVMNYIIKR